MLTEHEQLADHEARINKQELMQKLQPLQQPLDNIEEIRRALNDEWQSFETAPDEFIQVIWFLPMTVSNFVSDIFLITSKHHIKEKFKKFTECKWQHLPPPPKEQK